MTGTEGPNQPDDEADLEAARQVMTAIQRIMETELPNVRWMTQSLAHMLLQACQGNRTLMMMSLLKAGLPQPAAEEQANQTWPLLIFDLGLRVGRELEATRAMREMFGDDMPEWPDSGGDLTS